MEKMEICPHCGDQSLMHDLSSRPGQNKEILANTAKGVGAEWSDHVTMEIAGEKLDGCSGCALIPYMLLSRLFTGKKKGPPPWPNTANMQCMYCRKHAHFCVSCLKAFPAKGPSRNGRKVSCTHCGQQTTVLD